MTSPQILDGRFEVVRTLGRGGMGTVYEVQHVLTRQRAALKLLHARFAGEPEVVERFAREASAAARIKNPHIIGVSDAGRFADGTPYLVMELVPGEPLAELLRTEGRLEIADAIGITLQACDALGAAHAAGIVHRDLKPDNLFVSQRDGAHFIRVMDFGISKFGTDALKVTLPGMPMGTPLYMPPEQFREARDVDGRADVYSLGVVLYEMLAGGVPYEAKSYAELSVEVLAGKAPRLKAYRPDVPDALDTIVMRCLATDASHRVPSMKELARLLAPFANHPRRPEAERGGGFQFQRKAPLATPYQPPSLPPPTLGSRVWGATSATFKGALVVIALLAGFFAVVLFGGRAKSTVYIPPPTFNIAPLPKPSGVSITRDGSRFSLHGLGAIESTLKIDNAMHAPVTLRIEDQEIVCESECTVSVPARALKLRANSETCLGDTTFTPGPGETWVFNPAARNGYTLQEATYGGYMGGHRVETRIEGAVLFRVKAIDFLFSALPEKVEVQTTAFGTTLATNKRALARVTHDSSVTCSSWGAVRITNVGDGTFAAQPFDAVEPPSALVWVDVPLGTERLLVNGEMVADLPRGQHRLLLPGGSSTLSLGGFTGIEAKVEAEHTYLFAPGARRSFLVEDRNYGTAIIPGLDRLMEKKLTFRPPDFVELWSTVNFAPWPKTVDGFISAKVLRLSARDAKPWRADAVVALKKLEGRAAKLPPELLEKHRERIAGITASKVNDCDLALITASLREAEDGANGYTNTDLCPFDRRLKDLALAATIKTGGCGALRALAADDGGLPERYAAQFAACPVP